jgi:ArsR family transcriptional regulator
MATATIARSCCSPSCTEEVARTRFDDERLADQERALTAFADPTRLRILYLLSGHDSLCVCEIEAAFDLGQPTISHHLKILREAGIVTAERRGTWAYYALARPALKTFVSGLEALL